ncbi:hypothetical protein [Pseudoxanthomonas sp. USHLN014]|uniref:hypothetical protein n=1 Tax=Pseudoxanthomonas sp. USHLN014 TaxID=3081297 RepID=UPI00301DFAD4
MKVIYLVGWKPGCDKIGLNGMLRARFNFTLGEAKKAVDNVLKGTRVELHVRDDELEAVSSELNAFCVKYELA